MESQTVYIETRAGTGGDEASLWANELLRMYARYANKKNWKVYEIDTGVIDEDAGGALLVHGRSLVARAMAARRS